MKQTPPKFKYPLSWHHMKSLISHSHKHVLSLSLSLSLLLFFSLSRSVFSLTLKHWRKERKKSEILTCTFQSEIYWPIPNLCIFSPFALKDSTWGQYSIEHFSVRFPCFLNLLFVSFLISEKQILMNILFPNLKCKNVIALIFLRKKNWICITFAVVVFHYLLNSFCIINCIDLREQSILLTVKSELTTTTR